MNERRWVKCTFPFAFLSLQNEFGSGFRNIRHHRCGGPRSVAVQRRRSHPPGILDCDRVDHCTQVLCGGNFTKLFRPTVVPKYKKVHSKRFDRGSVMLHLIKCGVVMRDKLYIQ